MTDPYVLHNRVGSGGFVIEAALDMAGADWRLQPVESQVSRPLPESFRAINAWKQVPVLDLPDGSRMTESGAMLIHIAGAFPDTGIAPRPGSSEHAQFLRWTLFLSTNVYEAVLRRVYPDRYTTDPDAAASVKAAALARLDDCFALLEGEIGERGYLTGNRLSLVDVYLAMLYYWHDRLHATLPKCGEIVRRTMNDPRITPSWNRNFERA
jgi:glutathione S-transferase